MLFSVFNRKVSPNSKKMVKAETQGCSRSDEEMMIKCSAIINTFTPIKAQSHGTRRSGRNIRARR